MEFLYIIWELRMSPQRQRKLELRALLPMTHTSVIRPESETCQSGSSVITTAAGTTGTGPLRLMLFVYFLRDEDVSTITIKKFPALSARACHGWQLLRIATNLNLPRLLRARYVVEQPD